MSDPSELEMFRSAHALIRARIAAAAARRGRDGTTVQLVGISKTVPLERLRIAVAAGLNTLGENRVQEAAPKVEALPGVAWHLVGQLQGNKVGRALDLFSVIESVDSVALAERIARLAAGRVVRVLLQVNVDGDPAKAGFDAEWLAAGLGQLLALSGLRIEGLMTVGRQVERAEDARTTFVALRRLSESLRARYPELGTELSMGMSEDYEIAVEEGATIVRVGRALFGDRPTPA
jgi:pyridoxal phosphate enzyme (YggS family)